jgi:hypothetical protein
MKAHSCYVCNASVVGYIARKTCQFPWQHERKGVWPMPLCRVTVTTLYSAGKEGKRKAGERVGESTRALCTECRPVTWHTELQYMYIARCMHARGRGHISALGLIASYTPRKGNGATGQDCCKGQSCCPHAIPFLREQLPRGAGYRGFRHSPGLAGSCQQKGSSISSLLLSLAHTHTYTYTRTYILQPPSAGFIPTRPPLSAPVLVTLFGGLGCSSRVVHTYIHTRVHTVSNSNTPGPRGFAVWEERKRG